MTCTTGLALLIIGCVLSDVARGNTLFFFTTNINQGSLYQTAQLRFSGWSSFSGDPLIVNTDYAYFTVSTTTSCSIAAPSSTNNFTVSASADGSSGTIQFVVTPNIFTVGLQYVTCYVSTYGPVTD